MCESNKRVYLEKVSGAAATLAGGIVVNVGLIALLLVASLDKQFRVIAHHWGDAVLRKLKVNA